MNDLNTSRENAMALEERADEKRTEINRTLSQIEDRFSPGQVMDQAMGLFREHGGEMANNLGRSIRDNPVPMILTGVGLAWMALSQNSSRSGSTGRDYGGYRDYRSSMYSQNQGFGNRTDDNQEYYAESQSQRSGVAHQRGSFDADYGYGRAIPEVPASYERTATASGLNSGNNDDEDDKSLLDKARDLGADAREKLADVKDETSRHYRQGAQYARNSAQELQYRADERLQDLRGSLRSTTDDASRFMREQPLVVGAAGIALGAFIGALLPPTRIEDQLAGKYSDSITDDVQQAADEKLKQGASAVRERIERVAEDTRKTAGDKLAEVDARFQSTTDQSDSSVETI